MPQIQSVRSDRCSRKEDASWSRLAFRHDRNVRIREARLMARPRLDDVAADLRLPQGGLELRREAPRPRPHLLGEAEAFEHLQPPKLLTPEIPRCRGPRQSPVDRHEPSRSP